MLRRSRGVEKCLLFMVLSINMVQNGFAQVGRSPFLWRPEVVVPTAIISFSALGGAYEFKRKHPRIPTQESILRLKPEQVNSLDRYAIRQHSAMCGFVSDITLYTAPLAPLILLENPQARKDFGKILVMDAEVLLLNTAVTNFFKEAVHRPRPQAYQVKSPVWKRRDPENFRSFFSGHTSTVASQTFFFAYVWQQYHPNSKYSPLVWALSAGLPLTTALLRVHAGKHFWTDVLAGYAAGALIGVAVPWLHTTQLWNGKQ
ncbi:MAG: phosphatase PAP2 family protein [Chitinophagales bacterium]